MNTKLECPECNGDIVFPTIDPLDGTIGVCQECELKWLLGMDDETDPYVIDCRLIY